MKRINALEIPYPSNVSEANQAFDCLAESLGNGEELLFDMKEDDEESLFRMRIGLDALNDSIIIFHYDWLNNGLEKEKAIEDFTIIHLRADEARRVADVLKYFVKEIERKGGEQ